jgi:hypothetical protein
MQEQQTFQTPAQLFALKLHGAYMKVENVITFPFRWASEQLGQTDIFRQRESQLKLVSKR